MKKKRLLLILCFFTMTIFAMQDNKETKITIDPETVNTVVTDIIDRLSGIEKETPETKLQDLINKITNDKTQLKKKNTCLTITTGIVAVVAPIVTIVATTLTTSGGTALVEKILDALGSNCTCY